MQYANFIINQTATTTLQMSILTPSTKDISASRTAKNFFKKKLIFVKSSSKWMQFDSCDCLELASERMKTLIFKNDKKKSRIKSIFQTILLGISQPLKKLGNFLKKGKLIFIKKSSRWAQSSFCSLSYSKVTSKIINLYQEWLVQQRFLKRYEIMSSFIM